MVVVLYLVLKKVMACNVDLGGCFIYHCFNIGDVESVYMHQHNIKVYHYVFT